MVARVVVADRSEARFYDLQGMESDLRLTRRLTDAAAHLHNRDMVSDKPGRVFEVGKDLVHQSDAAIMAHVPWEELS